MVSRILPVSLVPIVLGVILCCQGVTPSHGPAPDAYREGLALWRTRDSRGRACASCHSPDGIELAAYSYDAATFKRRATPHLGIEAADKVSTYFIALRRRLALSGNLDPM